MGRVCLFVAALAAATGLCAAAGDVSIEPPRLVLEPGDGTTTLWVETAGPDGEIRRHRLRDAAEVPVPGPTGWGPRFEAAFANWREAGRTWTAYSRDAGASWSRPQPIEIDLRLHGGATAPGAMMPAAPAGLELPPTGRVFVVQFKTISLPEWRAALGDLGAEVLAFFPHNAHLVRMDRSRAGAVLALDFVERVEPYQPSYRLEAALQQWLADPAGPQEQRVRVMAFEWGPAGKGRISEFAVPLGARIADYWPSGHILELWVTRDQLRSIAAHDEVMWIDRWTRRETDMNLVRQDSGADSLESQTGNCGQGVRGEVMDNGIQSTHQDFDGILLHNTADVQSHGTNTYGIVFGNGARDGDGDATATGHLPCAEQGIFGDFGPVADRFSYTQELKSAPYFASFQTNSWGNARTTAYTSISNQMDDIIWRLDILITQSQSNAGNQQSRPEAWAKNIVAVGGIRHQNTLSEADDSWSNGASIGPAADGRIKPDLNYWYDSIRTTTTGNGYTSSFGGTSAATPEAVGVIGLMIQLWADNVWNTNPTGNTVFEKQPHFSTIKALAINNAKQYTFSGTGHDLTRVHQGWGRPNAQIAKDRAVDSFIVDEDDPLTVGQSMTYNVNVSPGEPELKVTMVYPDPPGTTSSTLHRINNVDLKLTSPGGTVYHGNVGLNAANYSSPGGSPNNVDTVENVFVQNPTSGTWVVEVTAAEVNQDGHLATPATDVAFALVVTGASGDPGVCGNGIREAAEECDGADLGGATCSTEGCTGGTLACKGDCTFDFINCTGCPTCDDDGTCETFEDCLSCANDCRTGTSASCGNGVCEIADGEDCLSCPEDCNGKQSGKPSQRYCCGNAGENPVDCNDGRCSAAGNSCTTSPAPESCCGDGTCEGDEDSFNCEIDCGPPASCGDSICSAGEDSCSCPADCGPAPGSEQPFSTCSDGQDNDCDGVADCMDADCSSDPDCSCLPPGSQCTSDIECCSERCKGNSTCK